MSKELNNKIYTDEELEELFKKGILSEEEFDGLVGNKMTETIVARINKEFDDYKEKILQLSKEEILNKSYETTCKQEIVDNLEYMDLYIDEKKALLDRKNLLDEFYNDWLDTDASLSESMENSIEETIIYLTRYYNDQKAKDEDDKEI